MRIKMTRRDDTVMVKERDVQRFLSEGWVPATEEKVSKIGKAKATADVIEEEIAPQEEEDNWTYSLDDSSMPTETKGDE